MYMCLVSGQETKVPVIGCMCWYLDRKLKYMYMCWYLDRKPKYMYMCLVSEQDTKVHVHVFSI